MEKRSVKPGNYNREMKSTKVLQGGKVIFHFSAMTSSIPGEPCSQTRSPGGQGLRLAHTSGGQQGRVCQSHLDLDKLLGNDLPMGAFLAVAEGCKHATLLHIGVLWYNFSRVGKQQHCKVLFIFVQKKFSSRKVLENSYKT